MRNLSQTATLLEFIYGALIGLCLGMGDEVVSMLISSLAWGIAYLALSKIAQATGMQRLMIFNSLLLITFGALCGRYLAIGESMQSRAVAMFSYAVAMPVIWQIASRSGKRNPLVISAPAPGALAAATLGLAAGVTRISQGKVYISASLDILLSILILALIGWLYGWIRARSSIKKKI